MMTFIAGSGWAQTAPPPALVVPVSGSPAGTTATSAPLIVQVMPGLFDQSDNPNPPISALGQRMLDYGVVFHAQVYEEGLANPVGGVKQSSTNVFSQSFGLDLDLNKILGIPGGKFYFMINHEAGDSLAQRDIGSGLFPQVNWKGYHGDRLALAVWSQDLLDGRVNIKGGRTYPLADFATNDFALGNFMSSSTVGSELGGTIQNGNLGVFPLSSWGGRIKVLITPKVYVQAGGYEADVGGDAFVSGFNFTTDHSDGQVYMAEAGYGTEFADGPYPRHLKVGAWWDDYRMTDLYANTEGLSEILHGGKPRIDGPNGGAYIQADQVIYRPDLNTTRNLRVFSSFYSTTDQINQYHSQLSLGMLFTGPFAARPLDTLGVAGDWYTLGGQDIAFLEAARKKVGGSGATLPNEGLFEVDYEFHLAQGVKAGPDLQYIVNPDTYYMPLTKERPNNALIVGFYVVIDLGDLMGLPKHL
jgi:porin